MVLALAVLAVSCKKEKNVDPSDPSGGGGGGTASGRFSSYKSCTIIAPPEGAKLDGYYKKYINCTGIPVVGSAAIPDEAFTTANSLLETYLKGKDGMRSKLVEKGCYYALTTNAGTGFNELPEVDNETDQIGGRFIPSKHIAYSAIGPLICVGSGPADESNTMVHEMAHMIHFDALNILDPSFDGALQAAYNSAKSKGLWANTYSMTAYTEYWADGVSIWYGAQEQGPPGGSGGVGGTNEIYTREQLKIYDPALYALIEKHLNTEREMPGCIKPPALSNASCGSTVTDIDGNVYNIVTIGNQCWMKENLKTTRLNDGTPITQKMSAGTFGSTSPAWIYYNANAANNAPYGKLYNWVAASNPKICPNGWHMPSKTEMATLLRQTNGKYNPGVLRATTGWINNSETTNSSGFSAMAGGGRPYTFEDSGTVARFWTSTDDFVFHNPNALEIRAGHEPTIIGGIPREGGLSCRCLKD